MVKFKSLKHITNNMADHSKSKDTQNISDTTPYNNNSDGT